MTKTKKNDNDGEIPLSVLHQIGEHTIGGFALFCFNPKTGIPQHIQTFDSPAHSMAMQKYISDYIEALHTLQIDFACENLQARLGNDEEDEEE